MKGIGSNMFDLYNIIGDQDSLKEKFNILEKIGVGGEATVFKVQHIETGDIYALVRDKEIKQLMSPNFEKPLISALQNNQMINPHQASLHNYFWVTSKNLGINKTTGEANYFVAQQETNIDYGSGDIVTRYFDEDETARTFRHRLYLLELGICDCSSNKTYRALVRSGEHNLTMELLTNAICCLSFKTAGINDSDNKPRNHILVPSNECYYGNQNMGSFDYWAYHLCEGLTIYVPAQNFLSKRIDFMDWTTSSPTFVCNRENCLKLITQFIKNKRHLLKFDTQHYSLNLDDHLATPDSDNILDIYPNKSYQPITTLQAYFRRHHAQIKTHGLFTSKTLESSENNMIGKTEKLPSSFQCDF